MGKFGPIRSKLSILAGNWHTEYLEDVDFYSVISFLNFLPEIYFWVISAEKVKVFVLPKNWHMEYLEDTDSYCDISFLNLQPKSIFGQIWAEKVKAVSFA